MASRIVLQQCLRHASRLSLFSSLNTNKARLASGQILWLPRCETHLTIVRNFATPSDEADGAVDSNEAKPVERVSDKSRARVIPVETSMKYMESSAYAAAYGDKAVWVNYRRNFKGAWAPETRKKCIRKNMISTGTPCPICRDEFLVLDYRNTKLLKQFISPYNGAILSTMETGLCQTKHNELLVAIAKAKDYGLISFDVPIRDYDYSDYHVAKEK